jgi:hypothetical protein
MFDFPVMQEDDEIFIFPGNSFLNTVFVQFLLNYISKSITLISEIYKKSVRYNLFQTIMLQMNNFSSQKKTHCFQITNYLKCVHRVFGPGAVCRKRRFS